MTGPIFLNQSGGIVSQTINDLVVDNSQWAAVKSEVLQKAKKGRTEIILFWVSIVSGILFLLVLAWKLMKK